MFDYGDLVMFANAEESTILAYRRMRGRVVEIEGNKYVKVAWYADSDCSELVGVDTFVRHIDSIKKAQG